MKSSNKKQHDMIRDNLTKDIKDDLKEAAGKCEKCNLKKDLEIHHIKSVESGGTNRPSNLIVLCADICHDGCTYGKISQKEITKIRRKRSKSLHKKFVKILGRRTLVPGLETQKK